MKKYAPNKILKLFIFFLLLFCIYYTSRCPIYAKTVKDTKNPVFHPVYHTLNQKAVISLKAKDSGSGLSYARYIKGTLTNPKSSHWKTKAHTIESCKTFTVSSSGNYSILVADKAGNKSIKKINVQLEMRAVWISYLDFLHAGTSKMTEQQFYTYIQKIFNNCKEKNLNTVIVQVRPFGDALYKSDYFPWSSYISGVQGKNPGYDPLKYMTKAAHKANLKFYAWVNPYRISKPGISSTKYLHDSNQAKKWRKSSFSSVRRNVLTYNKCLYYNPSKTAVQTLIVNGVKEIVKNYNVDGIVFDDYFYPSLGSSYKKKFDSYEYKNYVKYCHKHNKKPSSIVNWRRGKVNLLLKKVKSAIKTMDSSVNFGVSPQGNIKNLYSSSANYCDVKKWSSCSNYVDFISPQIYWSSTNKTSPFKRTLREWIQIRGSSNVNIYPSVAIYKAGITKKEAARLLPADFQWFTSHTNLKRQVQYARSTKKTDGFILYRYDNVISKKAKKEMRNLVSILK